MLTNTGAFASVQHAQTHTSEPRQYDVLWDQNSRAVPRSVKRWYGFDALVSSPFLPPLIQSIDTDIQAED